MDVYKTHNRIHIILSMRLKTALAVHCIWCGSYMPCTYVTYCSRGSSIGSSCSGSSSGSLKFVNNCIVRIIRIVTQTRVPCAVQNRTLYQSTKLKQTLHATKLNKHDKCTIAIMFVYFLHTNKIHLNYEPLEHYQVQIIR